MSDSFRPKTRTVHDDADSAERRSLPDWRDALRLRYVLSWIGGFLENWYFSRSSQQFLAGLPFLILVVGGGLALIWIRAAPQDDLLATYDQAVKQALQEERPEAATIYLKSMVAHRPQDNKHRFQLAQHLLQQGQKAEAGNYLRDLIQPGSRGYTPARLWLVSQATTDEPLFPLTQEALETQLTQILQTDPQNLLANRMLAELNLRSGQLKAAEDRLLSVVEAVPALSLPLAKVQRLLKRSPEQIEYHLANADRFFQQELLKDPSRVELRVSRSEVLMLQGHVPDAERVLKEGRAMEAAPELTDALVRLYVSVALRRLQASVLNRESALQLMLQALQLTPSSQSLLRQTLLLASSGNPLKPGDLAPSIDALLSQEQRSPSDELLLCQALAAAERVEEAIQRLQQLPNPDVSQTALLARLYLTAGKADQGQQLLQQMSDNYQVRQSQLTTLERIDYADVLLLQEQPKAAMDLLKSALLAISERAAEDRPVPSSPAADAPSTMGQGTGTPDVATELTAQNPIIDQRRLQVAYGKACLASFDLQLKNNSFTDADQALNLLDAALQTDTVLPLVVDRLAELSLSEHQFAQAADGVLTRLLATAVGTADIYSLLGTRALQLNQTQKARTWLQRASSLAPKDPMVLNNLALALVRDDPDTAPEALEHITEVLKILPEHPDALSTRAEILISLQRWEEARRDLEVVLPVRQTSANSRMLMATVYEALNEPELAQEHRRILKELEQPAASREN